MSKINKVHIPSAGSIFNRGLKCNIILPNPSSISCPDLMGKNDNIHVEFNLTKSKIIITPETASQ